MSKPQDLAPLCPCGSGKELEICCRPIIKRERFADTAEALMRSRYTAYVLNETDYLLYSWAAHTRPAEISTDTKSKWLGLKIKSSEMGQLQDNEGWVEFVARYKLGGKAYRLEERSYFSREQGRWVYVSAQ